MRTSTNRTTEVSRDLYASVARLEKEWMGAWCKGELDVCAKLMAEDFVMVSERGRLVGKEHWLEMAARRYKCAHFAWEDIRVRPFGRVVIVHARGTQQATLDGEDRSGTLLVTDVWVDREGSWQVVSRHGTGPLPASAMEAR